MGIRLVCSARAWTHRWEDQIVWTGGAPPRGEARRAVHDEYVAAELFRQDMERVGAVADIGYFRPVYLVIACRAIDGLAGTHVVITSSRLAAVPVKVD
jgi:hypothetical protein